MKEAPMDKKRTVRPERNLLAKYYAYLILVVLFFIFSMVPASAYTSSRCTLCRHFHHGQCAVDRCGDHPLVTLLPLYRVRDAR
jgi:hypothetical protein